MANMRNRSLREFLEQLDSLGQLTRVEAEVSAAGEIAEITRRVSAEGKSVGGGSALLFANVAGASTPVVTNLLGSERRACVALGSDSLDAAAEVFASRLRREEWKSPSIVATAACQQVVQLGRDIQLDQLPWPRSHVASEKATLDGTIVATAEPDTERIALGQYRVRIVGRRQLAMHWADHDVIARHFAVCEQRGERMPVAVVVAASPELTLVAAGTWDRRWNDYQVASCLTGNAVEVTDTRTLSLAVPATAEMVIEGHIDPRQPHGEDDTAANDGGLDLASDEFVIDVGMVTHRTEPMLSATFGGYVGAERSSMTRHVSRLTLPLLQQRHATIVDMARPITAPEQYALFSITKGYASEPRELAAALWGEASLRGTRFLVLVDADINLQDEAQVWRQVALCGDPRRDVIFPPANADGDHARSMLIDATRQAGDTSCPNEPVHELVSRRWSEYGFR